MATLFPRTGLVVVTGASAGIGFEFARQLAERGHSLLLVARRRERLEAAVAELRNRYRVDAQARVVDLADSAQLESFASDLSRLEPTLLVNNAGFGTIGFLHKTDVDDQIKMHNLHVLATLRLTCAVLPKQIERDQGGVINVSSIAAFFSGPGNVSYCATKAWMNSFTEGTHIELQSLGSNVRVQALCPGYTRSEFHQTMGVSTAGIPTRLWLSAEYVVRTSLRDLDNNRWLAIPGLHYRTFVALRRFVPPSLIHRLATRSAKRFRSENFR